MSDVYEQVKGRFQGVDDVAVNSGPGAQGMKIAGKMFVMFYKGDLVARLAPERVEEIIETAQGLPFDPGTGKAMADRVLIPASRRKTWIAFCEESASYARSTS